MQTEQHGSMALFILMLSGKNYAEIQRMSPLLSRMLVDNA